jgi:hypothetical protein
MTPVLSPEGAVCLLVIAGGVWALRRGLARVAVDDNALAAIQVWRRLALALLEQRRDVETAARAIGHDLTGCRVCAGRCRVLVLTAPRVLGVDAGEVSGEEMVAAAVSVARGVPGPRRGRSAVAHRSGR